MPWKAVGLGVTAMLVWTAVSVAPRLAAATDGNTLFYHHTLFFC